MSKLLSDRFVKLKGTFYDMHPMGRAYHILRCIIGSVVSNVADEIASENIHHIDLHKTIYSLTFF